MSLTIAQVTAPTPEARLLVGELEDILSAEYPPEQRHGLQLEAIFQPHIAFFIAMLDGQPAGCGGVARFEGFAEVKRMYVRPAVRGRGVAQALLARIEQAAHRPRLCLETGTAQHAAIALYTHAGFRPCGPFGDYAAMPPAAIATSLFFEKPLTAG